VALSSKSTLEEVQRSVVTSHFEDMKGHEFRFVYLMNLSDQDLLSKAIPKEELWRIAFQIYVAMTRAQDELWLFSVGKPSTLLEPLLPFVDHLKPADLI
jgi:superfamily I DNA/RNA helicase